jgi:hypothetical protein
LLILVAMAGGGGTALAGCDCAWGGTDGWAGTDAWGTDAGCAPLLVAAEFGESVGCDDAFDAAFDAVALDAVPAVALCAGRSPGKQARRSKNTATGAKVRSQFANSESPEFQLPGDDSRRIADLTFRPEAWIRSGRAGAPGALAFYPQQANCWFAGDPACSGPAAPPPLSLGAHSSPSKPITGLPETPASRMSDLT